MGNFSKDALKEFSTDAMEILREEFYQQEDLKGIYLQLREGIAEDLELFKKDGSPNIAKVKDGTLKKAVEKILHQKDKLKEEHELMLKFVKTIQSNSQLKQLVDINISNLEADLLDQKDKLKTKSEESGLDKEIITATVKIIREDISAQETPPGETFVSKNDPEAMKEYADLIAEIKKIIKE